MSIQSYNSGTEIVATIPLVGEDGAYINAQSVKYRIINHLDEELQAKTTLATFTSGDTDAVVTVSASINTVTPFVETPNASSDTPDLRELRVIELFVNDGIGDVKVDYFYMLEPDITLVEGINSFQGYGKSLIVAVTLQKIPAWESATRSQRVNALIEARRAFGAVPLRHYFNDVNPSHFDSNFMFRDITRLTSEQYVRLPTDLKSALCRAQIYQADHLLTEDDNEKLRDSGVIAITVGEAKQMMKSSVKYKGLLDKRAMKELSRWVINGIQVSR